MEGRAFVRARRDDDGDDARRARARGTRHAQRARKASKKAPSLFLFLHAWLLQQPLEAQVRVERVGERLDAAAGRTDGWRGGVWREGAGVKRQSESGPTLIPDRHQHGTSPISQDPSPTPQAPSNTTTART